MTAVRDARMERLVEALRAYELVPAPATTANLAAGTGVTRFAAYDLLSRLERRGRVWSVLGIHDGRVTRVWRLKESRSRRGNDPRRPSLPEAGDGCNAQHQRARG